MTRSESIHPTEHWHVEFVEWTGSTNVDLLARAVQGNLADRTVLRTGHQTAGRGRLDRRWDAPPGTNLLTSIYLRDVPDPVDAMHRIGLAILDAIETTSRETTSGETTSGETGAERTPRLGLKWPNDVLLDGRKLAGVLAQRSTSASGVVVGFGVNVGWAPEGAASVGELVEVVPERLLVAILEAYDALPADVGSRYEQRLVTIGQRVQVHLPAGRIVVGRATAVDDLGRLIVIPDVSVGTARHAMAFDVGDVVHLRPDA